MSPSARIITSAAFLIASLSVIGIAVTIRSGPVLLAGAAAGVLGMGAFLVALRKGTRR